MRRCLFVDHSSVIRKVAKRILGGPDLMVVEATAGAEGVALCAAAMPDVIVVDAALPDMPVVEFIRRVRQLDSGVTPRIAISLIEVDIGAIMRAKRAGANGYMLKPFDRPQLLERFRMIEQAAA